MMFTGSEKRDLLEIAVRAISEKVDPLRRIPTGSAELTPSLESRCGVFVSVYVDRKLRGCIGTFSEEEPLHVNVERMAVSSATSDTRFPPIKPEELPRLQVEISVLTPRQQIHDPSEIEIGKHGIFMKKGASRGTFLPQVAVSQDWTVQEFLGNCARYKAGIGWNGWKTAELYTYEAIVFSSDDPRGKS